MLGWSHARRNERRLTLASRSGEEPAEQQSMGETLVLRLFTVLNETSPAAEPRIGP